MRVSHRPFLILLAWLLIIGTSRSRVQAQADFIRFNALVNNRWTLGDVPDEARNLPNLQPVLRDSITGPDALEIAFAPWEDMDSLENVAVQWLLGEGMENLQKLAWLYDGFCLPLRSRLDAVGLPVSMACLPLMLTACDPSYIGPSNRAGIWALSASADSAPTCDRRHHLDEATERALAALTQLNNTYVDDPLQVVWSFVRAGRPDAFNPHPQPLESKTFDEWLTMYRVLVRFLENFDREDHRGAWLLEWAKYEEVACPGELSRMNLRQELGWNRRDQQTWIPWWRGDVLTCEVWSDCPVTLPAQRAKSWLEAFSRGISPESGGHPTTIHKVAAGETLGGIARQYGVLLTEIVAINNLDGDGLQVDQTLRIPALQ